MNNMDEQKSTQTLKSYLSFTIDGELFAMEVGYITKIIEMHKFTKVPQSPPYLLGLTNFGGGVLPVVDTRIKFGFPVEKSPAMQLILVLDVQLEDESSPLLRLGITIDEALEVFETDTSQIKDYPATGNKYKSEYISGVVERHNQFILLLDGNKLFSDDELGGIINTNKSN